VHYVPFVATGYFAGTLFTSVRVSSDFTRLKEMIE
jgi:hypothetical protein